MKEKYQTQFERFNRDVEKHAVTILRDDGLYRHLRCSTGSYSYSFDIVTWPGYLCYSGDMGCFVFTRIKDMFEFFRGRREALIDRGYLAEKTVASDKHDGVKEFSEELFASVVKERFEEFAEDLDDDDKADLWEDIQEDVLSSSSRSDGVEAAMSFRWRGREVFSDFWDHNLDEYTGRFWWCCYAVPWAIERYDALKTETAQASAAVDPIASA